MAASTSVDARQLILDANEKIDKLLADGKLKLDQLEKQIAEQDAKIVRQNADVQQQIEFLTGRARSLQSGDSLKNQAEAINALQGQIAILQRQIAVLEARPAVGEVRPPVNTKVDRQKVREFDQFLRVEQTAVKVSDLNPQGGRQSYDVTFKVCSFTAGTCNRNRLGEIFRVVYRFNKNWFSVSDVPVTNASEQFTYSVRVWGITKVRACIFLTDALTVPIIRAASMNLSSDPSYWGPDPSTEPSDCAGLSNI